MIKGEDTCPQAIHSEEKEASEKTVRPEQMRDELRGNQSNWATRICVVSYDVGVLSRNILGKVLISM